MLKTITGKLSIYIAMMLLYHYVQLEPFIILGLSFAIISYIQIGKV